MKALSAAAAIAALAWPIGADAQTANDARAVRQAYGSRLNDRAADPNDTGVTGETRILRRLNTRIDSRLRTRIERYTTAADPAATLRAPTDDGSRRPIEVVQPQPTDEPE